MSDVEESDNEGSKYDSDKDEPETVKSILNKPLMVDSDVESDVDLENEDFEENKDIINELVNQTADYQTSKDDEYDNISPINSDVDSDDEEYLQKFDEEIKVKYIQETHPECIIDNLHSVDAYTKITRDATGAIIDKYHKTLPFLTKYEKTRILGQRAQQINSGAEPFVDVPEHIIDGYLVAEMELAQKKIPFIIRRPMPNNSFEYWKIADLELF